MTRAPAAAGTLSACYRSLVLPFARAADVEIMARLRTALRAARDTQELDTLAEAIEIVALGSTRPALRQAIAGRLEDAEELLRDNAVTDPSALDQVVDAFEGLSLTLGELQARVRTVADVEDLVRPPAPPPRQGPLPKRGAMLEPAEDAADLVSVFRAELDLIASWAGVQPEALYRYVAERAMAGLTGDNQNYAFDDEPALRDELRRLGLEVTYRRPRPRRVERAMAEATAMLVDHGRLGVQYFSALDRLFRSADPYFVFARPTRRPSIVASIPERAISQYVKDDWTAAVTADNALVGRTMPAESARPTEGHQVARPNRSGRTHLTPPLAPVSRPPLLPTGGSCSRRRRGFAGSTGSSRPRRG